MGLFVILFNRWTILIIGIALMVIGLLPEYTLKAVRMIGMMGWAEERLGRGGTFSVWKIIGILAPIGAIIYFFSPGIHIGQDSQNTQIQPDSGYQSYYDNTNNYSY